MYRSRFYLLLCLAFFPFNSLSADIVRYPAIEDPADKRSNYPIALVELALKKLVALLLCKAPLRGCPKAGLCIYWKPALK